MNELANQVQTNGYNYAVMCKKIKQFIHFIPFRQYNKTLHYQTWLDLNWIWIPRVFSYIINIIFFVNLNFTDLIYKRNVWTIGNFCASAFTMKKVIIICTKLSKVLYKSVAFKVRNTKSYVTKIHRWTITVLSFKQSKL